MFAVDKRFVWSAIIMGVALLFCAALWLFCTTDPWPPGWTGDNICFASYASPIKSLDPATAYYVHESAILDNVVEAPLDYHYLDRPRRLIPRLLREIPEPRYFSADGSELSGDPPPELVARVEYLLVLLPDLLFQPHPCFARQADGGPLYWGDGSGEAPREAKSPQDYSHLATRAVTTQDFKVGLTRLCDPRLASPVFANLSSFVLGLEECSGVIKRQLQDREREASGYEFLPDYRSIPLAGLEIIDSQRCKIILSRKYPQALYWLAMHFFAPVPWEGLAFYHDSRNARTGLSFKNWPIGSGPFFLSEVDLSRQIILQRNPHYRRLQLAEVTGSLQPALERVVFQHERESIPNWLKFNQGYYDTSGVPAEMLELATTFTADGELDLSPEMQRQGIRMHSSVMPISYYCGFNMLDQVVGGLGQEQKALRQAIAMAIDYQEFIDIFRNGQGVPAYSIIPPGIFGAVTKNPVINHYAEQNGRSESLPLQRARELLAVAGFPNGIGPDGRPLTLYLDHAAAGISGFKAQFQWLKGKLANLGVQLEERPTDLNRWREKIMTGNWQLIFNKGWVADYPDPENFLFLFYSANGVVRSQMRGANYVNYDSPAFDSLFRQLETMANGLERAELIERACAILQEDAPCCWGFHPSSVILSQAWLKNYHPHDMTYNTLQYLAVDAQERLRSTQKWNRPRIELVAAIVLATSFLIWVLILISGRRATDLND